MTDAHPLVAQLRFTRSEFMRGVRGVSPADAERRLGRMNCLSWNVGHLAWQEQRYFVTRAQGRTPFPDIAEQFAVGAPGTTPALTDVLSAWRAITADADGWLETATSDRLLEHPMGRGGPLSVTFGSMLQRTIYHYWYHTGENQAIRQQLGHGRLPQFVGDIDTEAPYRPEPRG